MENKSNIPLGGTILLLALFAPKYSIERKRYKIKLKHANGDYPNDKREREKIK